MLLNEKGDVKEYNPDNYKDSDNSISQNIKKGLIFKREEVGGKVRYSYSIYLDTDPTSEKTLKAISYAKEQLENVIIGLKVEDKIKEAKQESLNG